MRPARDAAPIGRDSLRCEVSEDKSLQSAAGWAEEESKATTGALCASAHYRNAYRNDSVTRPKYSAKSLINGAPEEIRTPDPQIRSLVLYPAELRARFSLTFQGLRPADAACIRNRFSAGRESAP
jgi:hypothetical protein